MPVNVPLLDLVAQYSGIKEDVLRAMMTVVERQGFIMGPEVAQLEGEVARLSGTRHAIGCASGTDALLLPLRALDLKPGDEVITTRVHLLRYRGRHPQRGRDSGLRGHRSRHLQHFPARHPGCHHPADQGDRGGPPVRTDGADGGDRPPRAAPRARAHRRRGPGDRGPSKGGRDLAPGRRARHGRHLVVLPQQESGWVRRRRDDGHAGRRAGRSAAPAPAARRRPAVLSRGGRLQQPPRHASGGRPAGQAARTSRDGAAPVANGRGAIPTRSPDIRPYARRRSTRPTSTYSTSTRFGRPGETSCRPTSKPAASATRSTIPWHCTSSPVSPTWGTTGADCR